MSKNTTKANAEFQVGDGATVCGWSDRHAGTVIATTRTTVTVRRDSARLLNGAGSEEPDALKVFPGGFCAHVQGEQRYEYSPDPEGRVRRFSRRVVRSSRGERVVYVEVGDSTDGGASLIPGRKEYYDFNF